MDIFLIEKNKAKLEELPETIREKTLEIVRTSLTNSLKEEIKSLMLEGKYDPLRLDSEHFYFMMYLIKYLDIHICRHEELPNKTWKYYYEPLLQEIVSEGNPLSLLTPEEYTPIYTDWGDF